LHIICVLHFGRNMEKGIGMKVTFNNCTESTETVITNKQGGDVLDIITRDKGHRRGDEGRGAISKNDPIKPAIVF